MRRLYYCDHFEIPLPPGHKFPVGKYALVREILAREARFEFIPSLPADPAVIALAHDPAYVQAFVDGTLAPAMIRRIGFPWSEGLVNRTLGSAQGTLNATADALETGWGGNLAGGTHHAFYAEGSGFCVFNDFAVAIAWLRKRGLFTRAAIIDLDVHQGDGTAALFEHDPDVLTASLHCAVNFPFRKQRSRIDIELPAGTGDDAYLAALASVLPRVEAFAPQIVFFQSGVDVLATDTLGKFALTMDGLERRNRIVIETVRAWGVALVITLGGGYSKPLEITAQAHASVYRIALLS